MELKSDTVGVMRNPPLGSLDRQKGVWHAHRPLLILIVNRASTIFSNAFSVI